MSTPISYVYCQATKSLEQLPAGWYLGVEKTYCDKCKEMTPCHQYQGHFVCSKCKNLTGFWLPMMFEGVADIPGVKRWKNAKQLEPVRFVLNGKLYGI